MKTPFITKENAALWLIDMQEALFPIMDHACNILESVEFLLKVAHQMHIPTIVTEQTPEKLGKTLPALEPYLHNIPRFAKTSFSGFRNSSARKAIEETRAKQWILMGIETHICVLQSAKDLLNHGFEVIVLNDATSSSSIYDFSSALGELKECGARVTSSETIVYELLTDSQHPDFKTILDWVKKHHSCSKSSSSSSH